MSEQILKETLCQGSKKGGVRERATKQKDKLRTRLMINTTVDNLPYDVALAKIEKVCRDLHPGVCRTKHKDVLPAVLGAAATLRSFKSNEGTLLS